MQNKTKGNKPIMEFKGLNDTTLQFLLNVKGFD